MISRSLMCLLLFGLDGIMGREVLARGMWLRLGRLRSKVFCLRTLGGRFVFALASALCLRGSCVAVRSVCLCVGIRAMPSCFKRRTCAGRHLLFFAAAKKSRQKKAAKHRQPLCLPEGPQPVLRFTRRRLCLRALPTL